MSQQTDMTTFEENIIVLSACYPELATRLKNYPEKDKVCVFQAQDGGIWYGLFQNDTARPVTDHIKPLARMQRQLTQNSSLLQDLTKQVLIVGLYPGDELLYIFNFSEQTTAPHAEQQIYICVDSLACLQGFLITFDARDIIKSGRVRFFWHEDAEKLVQELRQKQESSYLFTLITGAPNAVLDRVMPPFAKFNIDRREELELLLKENNAYYNAITDSDLASIIARTEASGDALKITDKISRPPRFMTTTCSWSTVVQYSARDICESFKAKGWDTIHLNQSSILTPYFLAKQINEFKPDVFLFINHLRTEAQDVYPENLLFITWIQDFNHSINKLDSAKKWNAMAAPVDPVTGKTRKRDIIVGYTEQLRKYEYLEDRLHSVNMIVNSNIFKPRKIEATQRAKYACEVCFASNASRPIETTISDELVFALKDLSFTEPILFTIYKHLQARYRREASFTTYAELENELNKIDAFRMIYEKLAPEDRDQAIQILFWRMDDTIYRNTVIEWCSELDVNLKLYGKGWERHPHFSKYAAGSLKHGEELGIAYQCAAHCLHLNSAEGTHQRMLEILSSGGNIITRCKNKSRRFSGELFAAFRKKTANKPLSEPELAAWNNWLFSSAAGILRKSPSISSEQLQADISKTIHQRLITNADWMIPDWKNNTFENKTDFTAIIKH